jgi:glucokinase
VATRSDRQSEDALAIGVEIGGRGQRVVLATQSGQIVESAHAIGREPNAAATVELVCQLIDQLLRRQPQGIQRLGIGVAFGGPVDADRGVTLRSHRIEGFEGFPLVGVLEESFGIRTVLENDARAAALGEYVLGAGRGARDMVYLYLGVGVGGAFILDGQLQHGASMTSGEIGHMVVSADGPRCSCGKPGHLEAYASETAIVARMRERLSNASPQAKADWLSEEGVTLERIIASNNTDNDARIIMNETVQVIGLALANLVTALNPDAVVIGGYAAMAGHEVIHDIRAKIRQYAFDAAARRVTVTTGQLGTDAAIIGAAVMAARV